MPRVQEKGQVTLARALREELGIEAGDEVEERILRPGETADEAGILVTPGRQGFARFMGLLGTHRTDALLAEMRDG